MNIDSPKLDFSNVLIRPKRSILQTRSDVNLVRKFVPKYGNSFEGVPIIAANMATGTFDMLDEFRKHQMFVAVAKFQSHLWKEKTEVDNLRRRYCDYGFYTIGMNDDELSNFKKFHDEITYHWHPSCMKLCVDIANGYTQKFANFVAKIRDQFPNLVIVAGNVATPEMVQELVINGADFVKCGIGPGMMCTTRLKTGVGYPQISAAIECSDAAHGLGAGIVLDGGMRSAGDISKAFCANSDMVMVGGMFAGTDECDGEIITKWFENPEFHKYDNNGVEDYYRLDPIEKKYKVFYGMSSEYAQEKHMSGMKEYRTSEGRVEEVEYVGPVENIIKDILGGIRSTGTYIGADSIKNFGKCATLVPVSHVHDKF